MEGRIRAFDWLRGLAVIFMVETHSLAMLRPELRAGPHGAQLDFINGLVAPSFIFASGFSIGLTQVRAAYGDRVKRVRRTLRRISEVLGVGILINAIWFPIRSQPVWLLRLDILSCIAVSLFLALPLFVWQARKPKRLAVILAALALLVFLLAPYGQEVRGMWATLANRESPLHSVFPLLPWTGYVFLGGVMGVLAASQTERTLRLCLLAMGLLGAALWQVALHFASIYPPHPHVSDPGNHGYRWIWVSGILWVLLELELRAGPWLRRSLAIRWVELIGTCSLAGYFFHEQLLFFQIRGRSLAGLYKDQLGWAAYAKWLVLLLIATTLLVKAVDLLYPRWEQLLAVSQWLLRPRPRSASR